MSQSHFQLRNPGLSVPKSRDFGIENKPRFAIGSQNYDNCHNIICMASGKAVGNYKIYAKCTMSFIFKNLSLIHI